VTTSGLEPATFRLVLLTKETRKYNAINRYKINERKKEPGSEKDEMKEII
jgi:hypothetical protein